LLRDQVFVKSRLFIRALSALVSAALWFSRIEVRFLVLSRLDLSLLIASSSQLKKNSFTRTAEGFVFLSAQIWLYFIFLMFPQFWLPCA
jgi:hypothetical protein